MDRARFARLKQAFVDLQERPPHERSTYLEELARVDPDLRREIDAILAQHSGSFELPGITPGMPPGMAGVIEEAAMEEMTRPSRAPEFVGPYRIVELLGEGGMGVVYRAEQTEPIRREVALKLVRHRIDSPRIARRFEAERQTLSLMEHPNIARVLDAGVHDDGSPYIVMELIRGVPVTEYCRDHRVTVRRRLELFRTIARAVQHAHQKGVIHRDLKPSNILITTHDGEPVPKIIDFGIAKAMEPDPGSPTLTREGQLVGTLEYMSPEQAMGLVAEIDTRSDVYSLGVVLHELVTGALPYTLQDLTIPQAIRVITEEEPAHIRRTTTRERLDADVDTILRKAMEKTPDRRYGSAGALADDIDRFLRSEPIVARPASRAYLVRKFVVRHRTLSVAAGTTMMLLMAFGVVVAVMLGMERKARRHAELESRKSRRTTEFMREVLLASHPSTGGPEVTVRETLEAARKKLEAGPREEPAVEAEVRQTLAETYMALGRPADAEAQLRIALALCDSLPEEDRDLRTTVVNELGKAVKELGRRAEAESLYLVAIAMDPSEAHEDRLSKVEFMGRLATGRMGRFDYAGADSLFRKSIDSLRELSGSPFQGEVDKLRDWAYCQLQLGRLDEAEKASREALDFAHREPEEWRSDHRIGTCERLLGSLLGSRGRYVEAESLCLSALQRFERNASSSSFDGERVHVRLNTASIRLCRGDYAGAESLLVQLADLCEGLPRFKHQQVMAHSLLGTILAAEGRFAEAEGMHLLAVAEADSLRGHREFTRRCMADLRVRQTRYGEAEALYREALHALEANTVLETILIRLDLAMVLIDLGKLGPAEEQLHLLTSGLEQAGWSREWPAAVAANEMACCRALAGHLDLLMERWWNESRPVLLATPSPVPLTIRNRAIGHAIRAMGSIGRTPPPEYARALRDQPDARRPVAKRGNPMSMRIAATTAKPPVRGQASDAGGALEFTVGSWVRVPHAPELAPRGRDPWSVEFWMNIPYSVAPQSIMGMRFNCLSGPTYWGWWIGFSDPHVNVHSVTGTEVKIPGYSTWFHLGFVLDGDSLTTYLNGRRANAVIHGRQPEYDVPLLFGAAGTCSPSNFLGKLDEIRIWNVVRSAEDMAGFYDREVDAAAPGLVGYWKFNEDEGSQQALDSSPAGNHGILGDGLGVDSGDPRRVRSEVPLRSMTASRAEVSRR